ncbi:MAG: Rne/Rng family ribonuclease [Myxococcales bacterium]|nr:Rne/Rng family ribonuclease [Myxococcales bacterium]
MASRSGNRASGGGQSSAPNEIIVNVAAGETRVALIEQNTFSELFIEREREQNVAGMVVKGRVTRVLPGMQAAFVDVGLEKAAFLYVGDYLDAAAQFDGAGNGDTPRRAARGRNGHAQMPRIESLLGEGQEVVVQIAKEPIGSKGARVTSQISIAGRHLVLTPGSKRVGVSRRIESERERRRLRGLVNELRTEELGFIIRTAGGGTREADLEADIKYLTAAWDGLRQRMQESRSPAILHSELPLPLRAIRDFANPQTVRIVVDDAETFAAMADFVSRFIADPKPPIERYEGSAPIFDHFELESTIDTNLGKKVWLKSGGYLVVDQSEALTAIDVNTGRYVGKRDLEETVLKTNLEAVQEVVNQLRFRNIGGLIIVDLIDMESAENREKVYRAFRDAARADKAKTNLLKISELGLVEMTRKRTRENLVQQLCEPCSYCEGRGYVASAETVAYKVLREVRKDLPRFCGRQIALSVNPRVAEMLLGPVRQATARLGEELGREVEVRARPGLHQEQFEVTALDTGAPVSLSLRWLEARGAGEPETPGPLPESPALEAPEEPPGEESTAVPSAAETPEAAGEEGPAEPARPKTPDPVASPEDRPEPSWEEPDSQALAEAPGRARDGSPAEREAPPLAWGSSEPATTSASADEVETLAASPLDADVESPIIPPSDPPEES